MEISLKVCARPCDIWVATTASVSSFEARSEDLAQMPPMRINA